MWVRMRKPPSSCDRDRGTQTAFEFKAKAGECELPWASKRSAPPGIEDLRRKPRGCNARTMCPDPSRSFQSRGRVASAAKD